MRIFNVEQNRSAWGALGAYLGAALVIGLGGYFLVFRPGDWLPIFGLVAAVAAGWNVISANIKDKEELEPIRREGAKIRERIAEKQPDIFDTIQLNLNQMSEYYTINKSQARNSFRASVTAIIVGLVTIIAGIWFVYLSKPPGASLGYITTIGGVLAQFIGGAYFYLYNKSLTQLNFFFNRLTTIQDTMLSIKLCDQIGDKDKKEIVLERLIFRIIERGASVQIPAAVDGPKSPRSRTKRLAPADSADVTPLNDRRAQAT